MSRPDNSHLVIAAARRRAAATRKRAEGVARQHSGRRGHARGRGDRGQLRVGAALPLRFVHSPAGRAAEPGQPGGEPAQVSGVQHHHRRATDSQGSDSYNQALSERRAITAADYLAAQGVPRSRITTYGRGKSEPIATNETEIGRQENRRVEVAIYASPEYRDRLLKSQGQ